jgi:putative ABC transport system permease protein
LSFIIAAPLAWYFMHRWLEDFAYHTNINVWVFVLAGFCALFIALFTVSFQAIKLLLPTP